MKKPGNKKLLKSNRISGFQKADRQKLPIDKTRRIISQKFHFFKIFKVGLIGALIFGILFELALEHVPGLLLWSIYGIIVTVILKEIWDIVKERYKSTDEYKNMMSSSQSPWQKTVIVFGCLFDIVLQSGEVFFWSYTHAERYWWGSMGECSWKCAYSCGSKGIYCIWTC